MKARFVVILLLCFATPALAHQLDEFLQATTIDVAKDHIMLEMRLTPGADVFRAVFVEIDTNGDGVVSEAEQHAYVECVRQRLSLSLDGRNLLLVTTSSTFPSVEDMKGGTGDILLTYRVEVPAGTSARRLTFTNRHQRGIAAYLANCLVPSDPDIRIVKQDRNYNQSNYVLNYTQGFVPMVATQSDAEPQPAQMHRASMLIAGALALGASGFWIGSKRARRHTP